MYICYLSSWHNIGYLRKKLFKNKKNMKKNLLLLTISALMGLSAIAQESDKTIKDVAVQPKDVKVEADTAKKHWKFGGSVSLNFGQVALVNWAGGGQNSISALLGGNGFAHYKKGKVAWDTDLIASWGIIAQGKIRDLSTNKFPVRKNVDVFQLTSKAGYSLDKKNQWFAAGLVDFRSQFTNGYEYPGDSIKRKISSFAAPDYLTLSIGVNYKPLPYFSLYVSPLAGKFTFVNPKAGVDETRYGLEKGKVFRAEFGAYLRADFQKDIFKNVNLRTSLELFQNYLDKKHLDALKTADQGVNVYYDNRGNTDINWATLITFKINKFLQASLETNLIYDQDIAVPKFRADGTPYNGRGTQFREAFNLGIGYRF
jgi:hypothetical protein